MPTPLAFALAGLGGFNAHGAGFLAAADEAGIKPDLVTATSGQIVVVDAWLRGEPLESALIDPARPTGPLGTLMTAVSGVPDVFRPAVTEYWRRWFSWPASPGDWSAALLPAQEFVPLRTPAAFERIAATINGAAIGVLFNAYDPRSGKGHLFGNAAARAALPRDPVAPVTAEAVAGALWLSLYGFDQLPGGLMDGAYHRSCLVAELSDFDTIFAVQPLAQSWQGALPRDWFQAQDWQTEMWFSASFEAEVADMRRINALLAQDGVSLPGYKPIDLVTVAVERPAGFSNYFGERPEIFAAALASGRSALKAWVDRRGHATTSSGSARNRAPGQPTAPSKAALSKTQG